MKKDFIVKFFQTLEEASADLLSPLNNLNGLLIYESMSRKMLRVGGIDPDDVYDGFRNLKNRGIIKQYGNKFRISDKGKLWYKKSKIKFFSLQCQKWDYKWRIVLFDIPQEFHNERNLFRRKLKSLGFQMLQKSVFIFPYSCEKELGYLCSQIGIQDYVDILISKTAGFRENEFKKIYGI